MLQSYSSLSKILEVTQKIYRGGIEIKQVPTLLFHVNLIGRGWKAFKYWVGWQDTLNNSSSDTSSDSSKSFLRRCKELGEYAWQFTKTSYMATQLYDFANHLFNNPFGWIVVVLKALSPTTVFFARSYDSQEKALMEIEQKLGKYISSNHAGNEVLRDSDNDRVLPKTRGLSALWYGEPLHIGRVSFWGQFTRTLCRLPLDLLSDVVNIVCMVIDSRFQPVDSTEPSQFDSTKLFNAVAASSFVINTLCEATSRSMHSHNKLIDGIYDKLNFIIKSNQIKTDPEQLLNFLLTSQTKNLSPYNMMRYLSGKPLSTIEESVLDDVKFQNVMDYVISSNKHREVGSIPRASVERSFDPRFSATPPSDSSSPTKFSDRLVVPRGRNDSTLGGSISNPY